MALQKVGSSLTLGDIADEFEGDAPHSLSEYYGSDGVVESGRIRISYFYGKENYKAVLNFPEKLFYVYEGGSCFVPTSFVLNGSYDELNPDNVFRIVGVENPVGGTVSFDGGSTINFNSTGLVGEPAGFRILIHDQRDFPLEYDVSIVVIEPKTPLNLKPFGDCLIENIIGIKEIKGEEPELICKILMGVE